MTGTAPSGGGASPLRPVLCRSDYMRASFTERNESYGARLAREIDSAYLWSTFEKSMVRAGALHRYSEGTFLGQKKGQALLFRGLGFARGHRAAYVISSGSDPAIHSGQTYAEFMCAYCLLLRAHSLSNVISPLEVGAVDVVLN
jgi:hypothetical protein